MLLRVYYRQPNNPPFLRLIVTISIIILGVTTDCVTSRSIPPDDSDLIVDKSDVPARYVYEIDEDGSSGDDGSSLPNQGISDSRLTFDMPIAAAVFLAVMFLVCCFCCLRCAVTYDGMNRTGFYERKKKTNVARIVESLSAMHHAPALNEKK